METFFCVTGSLCGEFIGHRWLPHKGQWRGALMFSLICAWINRWVNNREAGDLRRHRGQYNVNVMTSLGSGQSHVCHGANDGNLEKVDNHMAWIATKWWFNRNEAKRNKPLCEFVWYVLSARSSQTLHDIHIGQRICVRLLYNVRPICRGHFCPQCPEQVAYNFSGKEMQHIKVWPTPILLKLSPVYYSRDRHSCDLVPY